METILEYEAEFFPALNIKGNEFYERDEPDSGVDRSDQDVAYGDEEPSSGKGAADNQTRLGDSIALTKRQLMSYGEYFHWPFTCGHKQGWVQVRGSSSSKSRADYSARELDWRSY